MSLSARIAALETAALALGRAEFFNDSQLRDDHGRWSPAEGDRVAMHPMRGPSDRGQFQPLKPGQMLGTITKVQTRQGTDKPYQARVKWDSGSSKQHGLGVIRPVSPEEEEAHSTAEALKKAIVPPAAMFSARISDLESFVLAAGASQFAGKGNPDALRHWYADDPQDRFHWGDPGDFMKCVEKASEYMTDDEAKGFCNLRHKEATGHYPGEKNAHG